MSGDTLYWAYILWPIIKFCLIGAGVLTIAGLLYWLGQKIDGI